MTNTNPACEALAKRYDAKQGLKDVKFLLKNPRDTSYDEACEEFERLLARADEEGGTEPLDFGDLRWQDEPNPPRNN